jgi:NAD(P)-dependent dehydrogenase (short-subunit alcohol dehydrogenase family)
MVDHKLAIVAGAGPGLGHALLRRFEEGGMKAVGLVRSAPPTDTGLDIRTCDLSDAVATKQIISDLIQEFGPPKIVVHNPNNLVIQPLLELNADEFEASWRAMVLTALQLGQAVLQPMVRGGGGAFIVSGAKACLRGGAKFAALASAKFAQRGLTQSMAREFQPSGIHVIHAILDGIIDTKQARAKFDLDPAKMMKTADIAQAYWQLAHQPASAWTHEVDLRPQSENF